MAKRKVESVEPKALFMVVDEIGHRGSDDSPSNDGPYSGFSNEVIEIVHIEAQHQGYFADFEGIDIHIVDFAKDPNTVECKRW